MKRRSGSSRTPPGRLHFILAAPAAEDVVVLLRAWRFWILGGLVGALLGTAVYVVMPPPFRARATVNVDFHLEQAWPQNTDREQFYYLERETRKLIEIATSDETLSAVTRAVPGFTLLELRGSRLQLSQPGNGGWHFYADDRNAQTAASLASAWARAFAEVVQARLTNADSAGGLEPFITVEVTQSESIVPERSQSLGLYILVGAGVALSLSALGILFVHSRP